MYFFYIDESGQIDYNPQASKYFVLNALGFNAYNWLNINDEVTNLKREIFNTPNAELLEIKSNWLRIPTERQQRWYLEKLSNQQLLDLTNGLYDIILRNNIILIAVVINKDLMIKNYGKNAYQPNIFALKLLLEKISLYMNSFNNGKLALIMMDKSSNDIEAMLNEKHVIQRTKNLNFNLQNANVIIENLLFVDSKFSNFIQLTDLCAYNIFRAFKYDNPDYEYFNRIVHKYYLDADEHLYNCGIVYKPAEESEIPCENIRMIDFLKNYQPP